MLKKLQAYIAIASFFVVLFIVLPWFGPFRGWKLDFALIISLPYGLWVLWAVAVYETDKREKSWRDTEEYIERKAAAEERSRVYNENYEREEKALRKCVADGLKTVARGDRQRLDFEAVEAAKRIMERQGVNNPGMAENYPEIVTWTALIHDLSADRLEDPKAIHDRLADLLWPETLEDVDALKRRVKEGLAEVTEGRQARLDRDALEAAKTLNEIRERDARKKREEWELEAAAIRKEKEAREKHASMMEQMAKSAARNRALIYGLPENTFEGMSLQEQLTHARVLRLSRKFEHLPVEERQERVCQELEKEPDQERDRKRGESC